MSVVYSATVKNNRMTQVLNAADAGTGTAGGGSVAGNAILVIGTSALSGATGVLATITLAKPSATVSGGVLTISGLPLSATAGAGGTAAKAEIRDSTGAVIVSGLTVGTSASDVIINSTTISSGQTVTLNSVSSITHG